jgi:predicted HNH restriction endonuclease
VSNFKVKPFRSPKYIKWIKTLSCCNCEAVFEIDPHHLTGVGLMGGAGTTAPDSMAMPLCRRCHTLIHDRSENVDMQWEWIARTLNKAINEGIFKI